MRKHLLVIFIHEKEGSWIGPGVAHPLLKVKNAFSLCFSNENGCSRSREIVDLIWLLRGVGNGCHFGFVYLAVVLEKFKLLVIFYLLGDNLTSISFDDGCKM